MNLNPKGFEVFEAEKIFLHNFVASYFLCKKEKNERCVC